MSDGQLLILVLILNLKTSDTELGNFSQRWNWLETLNKLKESFIWTSVEIFHCSLDEAVA